MKGERKMKIFTVILMDKNNNIKEYEYKTFANALNILLKLLYKHPMGNYTVVFKCRYREE